MNDTNQTPSSPQTPPPLAAAAGGEDGGLIETLESLLKRPVRLVEALQQRGNAFIPAWLMCAAILALLGYGLLVGSFSGGEQLIAAPLKIAAGALVSVAICLPSLFIFACLTGADISVRGIAGLLAAILALTALLLVGFAPVAWVFSQSTDSVAFIGTLHLVFWLIALGFGLRLLRIATDVLRVRDRFHLRVWTFLFILVTLQMTTALRPIVGTAPTRLPTEKKFFLQYWGENLFGKSNAPASN